MMRTVSFIGIISVFALVGSSLTEAQDFQIVLEDLNEPRGLLLRANGTLCVAESGRLAPGQEPRRGPTANKATTGSLSCLDAEGNQQRLIEGLPYVFYNIPGTSSGPADVAEMDDNLYLLVAEGSEPLARTILHIRDHEHVPEVIADFLMFSQETNEMDGFDQVNIPSNPFAMVVDAENHRFLVTDGATGHVLSAGLDGHIEVFSEVDGHEVLAGIIRGPDGLVYVASFSQLPHDEGAGSIVRLRADGTSETILADLTAPIDLAFDAIGRLYVVEFMSAQDTGHPYRGKVGRLLRFSPDGDGWGKPQVLVEGLPYPVGIVISPDDSIYLTIHGAFSSPGSGRVLRIDGVMRRESTLPALQYQEP